MIYLALYPAPVVACNLRMLRSISAKDSYCIKESKHPKKKLSYQPEIYRLNPCVTLSPIHFP